MDLVDHVFQFLSEDGHDDNQLCAAWNFVSHVVDDGDESIEPDLGEGESVPEVRARFYEMGILDLVLREMSTRGGRPLRFPTLKRALVVLTMASLSSQYYKRVCEHPLMIQRLNELCEDFIPEVVGAYAITCLTNLAVHSGAHPYLIKKGSLAIAQKTMLMLRSTKDSELDCGLSAAFFMCRLTAKKDPNLVLEHPLLVEKLAWILDEVIKTGLSGVVLGYNWNPANIMMDICTLVNSNCDRNLFARFVPLIVNALQKRPDNQRMVRFSVLSLLFLVASRRRLGEETVPKELKQAFIDNRDRLIASLRLIARGDEDLQTSKNAVALKHIVEQLKDDSAIQVMVLCSNGNERIALATIERLQAAGVKVTTFEAGGNPSDRDETSTIKLYLYKPVTFDDEDDCLCKVDHISLERYDFLKKLRLVAEGSITHYFPVWDVASLDARIDEILVVCKGG